MKLFRPLSYAGPVSLFFLLFAAPAFAQFEVSPDHFDNQSQPATKPSPLAKKKPDPRLHHPAQTASMSSSATKSGASSKTGQARRSRTTSAANATPATTRKAGSAKLHTKTNTGSAANLSAQANPVPRE